MTSTASSTAQWYRFTGRSLRGHAPKGAYLWRWAGHDRVFGVPNNIPTLHAWAGGDEALTRLCDVFYGHVKADDLLAPVFARMDAHHPQYVALWLAEVFGGPPAYTERRGGYPYMLGKHLGRALTEPQ